MQHVENTKSVTKIEAADITTATTHQHSIDTLGFGHASVDVIFEPGEVEERIKMAPSEYFKRQCWIGFEAREPCLRAVVDFIGAERLLYGTDFPHPDHMNFQLDDFAVDNYVLNQQELHFVFRENPRAFFGN